MGTDRGMVDTNLDVVSTGKRAHDPNPYSPANDMLWLVYFLAQLFLLNACGIVHKWLRVRFHELLNLGRYRVVSDRDGKYELRETRWGRVRRGHETCQTWT